MTHHNPLVSSEQGIGPSQRPVSNNIQHLEESSIHAQGRMRTRNSSKLQFVDHLATGSSICVLFVGGGGDIWCL
jgi:hypothetical protein